MTPQFQMWTLSYSMQDVLIALNALVCACIFGVVVCRALRLRPDTTRLAVKTLYMGLGMAAVASGGSSILWDELPGPGQIGMGLCVLMQIIVWRENWAAGQPPSAMRKEARWNGSSSAPV